MRSYPTLIVNAPLVLTESIDAAPDITHEAGIAAILKGLGGRSEKGYYIHTSGVALIWDEPDGSKPGTKIWDDVADIDEITSMPEEKTHRQTDKVGYQSLQQ